MINFFMFIIGVFVGIFLISLTITSSNADELIKNMNEEKEKKNDN